MTKKIEKLHSKENINLSKSKEDAIKHQKNVLAHSIKRERTLEQIIESFK